MTYKKQFSVTSVLIALLLGIFALCTIYPLYNVFLTSVTPYQDSATSGFYLYPKSIDWTSYELLFKDATVPRSLLVSLTVTLLGTAYSMLLSITMGYALSKKGYIGRNFFLIFVVITMFFSGGLIPYYLVVRDVGLIDSLLSMIIPTGINTFYMIIIKSYFSTIPENLEESARIDGANDIYILFKIVIPLSAPILATMTLFYAVDRWNEWFNAMLFIKSPDKLPLQIILRNMLVSMEMSSLSQAAVAIQESKRPIYAESLRAAIIIITSLPILMFYPFLQKYFTKGIMLGSIKS